MAAAMAMPACAVKPSGGAADGISEASPVSATSPSSNAAGSARLPSPSKAANHKATTTGNAGCVLNGAFADARRTE